MDVPTLYWVLRPILTVTTVWNTGETGDITDVNTMQFKNVCSAYTFLQNVNPSLSCFVTLFFIAVPKMNEIQLLVYLISS